MAKSLPLIFLFFISCSKVYQIQHYDDSMSIKSIDICNIEKTTNGQLVSIIGWYSGFMEYWGLNSNTSCISNNGIYVNTDRLFSTKNNSSLKKRFKNLYKNDWEYSIKLNIIGEIQIVNDSNSGYGHLNLQEIQIIPYQIRILDKKTNFIEDPGN